MDFKMETFKTNKIMISQETEEEIESQILSPRIPSKMEKKEREPQNPFVVLLKLTGLYFGNRNKENYWYYKENFWYYMGMLRALIMCALASYQAAVIVYKLFTLKSTNEKIPNTIFIASWHIQAALSMIFVVYWQLQGHLSQLFNVVNWPKANQNLSTHRSIRFTLIILITFMLFILIYITLNAYVLTTGKHKYFLTDLEFLEIFGTEQYRYFSVFVTYLASNIWLIVLVFYVIISIIAHGEFVRFNHDLEKIGEIDEEEESIRDQLLEEYSDHINKAKMVRIIDHTFEVYTFLMIGLNIPTTIFGIISCFTAPTTEQLLLALPAPIFCILQLVGLTAVPARVHTAIRQVKEILYSNSKIWKPYNEQIYQIASVFISHVEQANLGFSLWGFAVVTKPLILTTVSITITYLTILIQLKSNHDQFVQQNG